MRVYIRVIHRLAPSAPPNAHHASMCLCAGAAGRVSGVEQQQCSQAHYSRAAAVREQGSPIVFEPVETSGDRAATTR